MFAIFVAIIGREEYIGPAELAGRGQRVEYHCHHVVDRLKRLSAQTVSEVYLCHISFVQQRQDPDGYRLVVHMGLIEGRGAWRFQV